MGDKIAGWIEKLATGKKARFFWAMVIAVLVFLVASFPFIDATFFFYDRVELRINNLEKLVSISGSTVYDDAALQAEYQDILQGMETARTNAVVDYSFNGITRTDIKIKFWSAALIGIVFVLAGLFGKRPAGNGRVQYFIKNRIPTILIGAAIGFGFGLLFTYIPTLGSPWVNAVIGPIVEVVFLDLLLSAPKNKQHA